MKNLILSESTVSKPGDGKYVNYAEVDDVVNYFQDESAVVPELNLNPSDVPNGVTILTTDGEYVDENNWDGSKTPVGIAVKDGENSFIMALQYGSNIQWSTEQTDVASLPNVTSTDKFNYDSRNNTSKILAAQPNSSIAAKFCRDYSVEGIGAGKWDLPAGGILNIIVNKRSSIKSVLTTLGVDFSTVFNGPVWSSTEYSSTYAWYYNFYDINWGTGYKNYNGFVVPVHMISFQTTINLDSVDNMPTGVSIVDINGNYVAVDDWITGNPWTGLAISNDYIKFVLGVGDSNNDSVVDDLSINSKKYWSNALYGTDIAAPTNYTSSAEAIKDFASKANTDAILEALSSSSNPSETNNAAVVARAYSAGAIEAGNWDLPAAGVVQAVVDLIDEVKVACEKLGTDFSTIFSNGYVWSSTEYSSANAWHYNFYYISWVFNDKYNYAFVVPVYTISYDESKAPHNQPTGGDGTINPDNIASGVSVVDASGNVMAASEWSTDKGITGLALSDGTHKIIMAVDGYDGSFSSSVTDDMKLCTAKYWSNALYGIDVPNILTTTDSSEAIKDFASKANTDAILEALSSSSNPSETNNAAVVARAYSAGAIEAGNWDLPAAGHLNMIVTYLSDILTTLNTLDAAGLECSNLIKILDKSVDGWYVWSSTEYSSGNAWAYNFYFIYWNGYDKRHNVFVVPVRTIS